MKYKKEFTCFGYMNSNFTVYGKQLKKNFNTNAHIITLDIITTHIRLILILDKYKDLSTFGGF